MNNTLFEKIRVSFLFENPFLSVLALSIPIIESKEQKIVLKTNGREIFCNYSLLEKYPFEELKYLYAHQLLHIILKHPSRCKERDKSLWNLACEMVVDNILSKMNSVGVRAKDSIVEEQYEDMLAEEIYAKLSENREDKKSIDQDSSDLIVDKVSFSEIDSLILQALTLARRESNLPSELFREIGVVKQSDIGIREILQEYFSYSLFDKLMSFDRPNRRYIHKNIYLPGTQRAKQRISLVVAADSSASVRLEEFRAFIGAILEIGASFYEYEILFIPFDESVYEEGVSIVDSGNINSAFLSIKKREGGTRFNSVVEYLERRGVLDIDVLLLLSDGALKIDKRVSCDMIFAITQNSNVEKFQKYGRAFWLKV